MFPYIEIFGLKLYMTGLGIIISLFVFVVVAAYLIKKRKQSFLKFFYWIPLAIILMYVFWAYVQFVLDIGWIPTSLEHLKMLFSPYGYKFHFIGILIWLLLAMVIFFRWIQRYENKKIWADIFFFSFSLALVPLWLFLLLWDNFIGKTTNGILWVQSLHQDSELNKFTSVYPIWLFLSIGSLIVTLILVFLKKIKKKFGLWMWGMIFLLIMINLILLIQQYPRYWVVALWNITFDIKQHISFIVIMFCLWIYYKWERR